VINLLSNVLELNNAAAMYFNFCYRSGSLSSTSASSLYSCSSDYIINESLKFGFYRCLALLGFSSLAPPIKITKPSR